MQKIPVSPTIVQTAIKPIAGATVASHGLTAPLPTFAPFADPDFVDHVFAYLLREFPELAGPKYAKAKRDVRAHFGGDRPYIPTRRAEGLAHQVLALFNGRNATEVARELNISRASVYRHLKQAGRGDGSA